MHAVVGADVGPTVGVAIGCAAVIAAGDGATASTCSTDHTIAVDATGHDRSPNPPAGLGG